MSSRIRHGTESVGSGEKARRKFLISPDPTDCPWVSEDEDQAQGPEELIEKTVKFCS